MLSQIFELMLFKKQITMLNIHHDIKEAFQKILSHANQVLIPVKFLGHLNKLR